MPLPIDFSPWEHLQGLLMSLVNRMVTDEFNDLDDGDLEDIRIPRGSLRVACWLRDSDTAEMTIIKLFLFFIIIRKGNIEDFLPLLSELGGKNKSPKRLEKPKVSLFFSSNASDNPSEQIWRVVSCRIMDETSNSFSRSKAISLANKIKSIFGIGNGFTYDTGKTMYSYSEWDRGYQFQILGQSEEDAKKIIREVMGLQAHVPNWSYFNTETNDAPSETYPNTPPRTTIMGESFQEPKRRPVGKVYFRYATLSLPPKKPVTLFDKTGRRFDPLID